MGEMKGAMTVRVSAVALCAVAFGVSLPPAASATFAPKPVIAPSDEVHVGRALTASPGSVFHWQRCDPREATCVKGSEPKARGFHHGPWESIPGASGHGVDTYTPTAEDIGHLVRVWAKQSSPESLWRAGWWWQVSEPVGPVLAAPALPAPPALEGPSDPTVPPPVFNETGNLEPTEGAVWVKLPSGEMQQVEELTQIPDGSTVDVTGGRARLITQRRPGGPLQQTEEWGGAFVYDQRRKGKLTDLTLTNPLFAPNARRAAAARRGGRRLWGRGRCKCRTNGRHSSGTARGTYYLVKDTPRGTLTRVKHGKVLVKEFRTGKKILLRAGEAHLARAKRGGRR